MRLLCASANSSPRWFRLEEGVIRVADGRGMGDLDSPTPFNLKIHDCDVFDLRTSHWNSYPPLEPAGGGSFPRHPNARPACLFPGDRGHRKLCACHHRPSLIMRKKLPCPRTLWGLSVTLTN